MEWQDPPPVAQRPVVVVEAVEILEPLPRVWVTDDIPLIYPIIPEPEPKFDRNAYQRELMRKRRAAKLVHLETRHGSCP